MLKYIKHPYLVVLLVAILSMVPFLRFMGVSQPTAAEPSEAVVAPASGTVTVTGAAMEPVYIRVVSSPVFKQGCAPAKSSSVAAVQSAGIIDLNQPASCFDLSFSAPVLDTQELSVRPLIFDYSHVVVKVAGVPISLQNFNQGVNTDWNFRQVPLIYISFIPFLWYRRLRGRTPSRRLNFSARKVFSLQELVIMRC